MRVSFDQPIAARDMIAFRGAVVEKVGLARELYHNHNNDPEQPARFHYRYPLIQYVRVKEFPAILFIGEAISEARHFFEQQNWDLQFHNLKYSAGLDRIHTEQHTFGHLGKEYRTYNLSRWLALNGENYERYLKLEKLSEQVTFLEGVLCGQLLGLATGLGLRLTHRFEAYLTELYPPRVVPYKDTQLFSFRASFRTNLALPTGLGIGKGVALGHGRIYQPRASKSVSENKARRD